MPCKFATNVCVFICLMPVDDQQINCQSHNNHVDHKLQVSIKNRVKEEVSPWSVSMSWLQKLNAAMKFLLHWTKLVGNLALTTNIIIDGKSSWTMCLTMHHPMLERCIQAFMVYWCLLMIFFSDMSLSFMSRVW